MNKLILDVLVDSSFLIRAINQAQLSIEVFMKASDAVGQSRGYSVRLMRIAISPAGKTMTISGAGLSNV